MRRALPPPVDVGMVAAQNRINSALLARSTTSLSTESINTWVSKGQVVTASGVAPSA